MGFIATHQWPYKAKRCLGKTTLHVRPIASRIDDALDQVDDEAYRIAVKKLEGPTF